MTAETSPISQIAKRQTRYKLYFWLMDLCLFFGIVGFIDFIITRIYGDFPEGAEPAWYVALAIVAVIVSFLIAPILIVARFMRDEYAEQLWKRTTNVIVMVVTILPYIVFSAGWLVWFVTKSTEAPFPFSLLMIDTVWWSAIAGIWKTFCLLFVAIFQFLRWKDSR